MNGSILSQHGCKVVTDAMNVITKCSNIIKEYFKVYLRIFLRTPTDNIGDMFLRNLTPVIKITRTNLEDAMQVLFMID